MHRRRLISVAVNKLPDLGGHTPLYLLILAVVAVMLLGRRVPFIGRLVSFGVTASAIVLTLVILSERAQFDPMFARMAQRFQWGEQQAVGRETKVRMAPDGHFWVRVKIGDYEKRMLVDSGATVTALSADTAAAAGIEPRDAVMPVMMQTANGTIAAQTATVSRTPHRQRGRARSAGGGVTRVRRHERGRDEFPVAVEIVAGGGRRTDPPATSSAGG